ncbi:MAG: hypothetical protein ACLTBF_02195 [Christensenellales bacterium]
MRLVGDALFSDAIRTHATQTRNLASALGERMSGDTADAFHQRLVQAASQGGGRLLVVDTDGKVTDDTFGERCGTLLALSEVHTILRGEKDADYGFHLQDGAGKTQAPSVLDALTGRDVSRIWVGCFAAPLEEDGQRLGVLVLLTDVLAGDGRFADFRARPHGVHLPSGAGRRAGAGGADFPHCDQAGCGAFRRH